MRYFFDSAIFFILFFSLYWMCIIIRSFFYNQHNSQKTKTAKIAVLILLILIFITVFDGSFIEPRKFSVAKININLNKTPENENIKIVFIADLHLGPYKQKGYLTKIVNQIIELKPDLALLGGDYIENKEKDAIYLEPLKNLSDKFSIFAVTGNHEFNQGHYRDKDYQDKTAALRKLFKEWNINILDNANQILTVKNSQIAICGIEDIWTGQADLTKAGADIPAGISKILLAHNPDVLLDKNSKNFDLILSGHTHAGQFRLPLIGPIVPIPDQIGRRFDYGLFNLQNNYLYITNGLGETGARARLFNKPEIAVINLDL